MAIQGSMCDKVCINDRSAWQEDNACLKDVSNSIFLPLLNHLGEDLQIWNELIVDPHLQTIFITLGLLLLRASWRSSRNAQKAVLLT